MKHLWMALIFSFLYLPAYANTGDFFTITERGKSLDTELKIALCLNGNGPVTCQNYTITQEDLSIQTVVPNRTYAAAGIKIDTSGYTYEGCRLNTLNYCLFSVKNTTATQITIKPSGDGPKPPPP
jgi:hypothetical protein